MKTNAYIFESEEAAISWSETTRLQLMVYTPIITKPYFDENQGGWYVEVTLFGAD